MYVLRAHRKPQRARDGPLHASGNSTWGHRASHSRRSKCLCTRLTAKVVLANDIDRGGLFGRAAVGLSKSWTASELLHHSTIAVLS